MRERDGYPSGVPCWVDIFSPDLDAAMAFYGEVFGWSFVERTPPGAPQRYAMAQVDGFDVAGQRSLGKVPVLLVHECRPSDGRGPEEDRRRQPVHGLRLARNHYRPRPARRASGE